MLDDFDCLPLEMVSQRDLIKIDVNRAIKSRQRAFKFDDEAYNQGTIAINSRSFLKPINSRLKYKVERWYYNKVDSIIGFNRRDYPDAKKALEAKAQLVMQHREELEPYTAKYEDYMERCKNAIRIKQKKIDGKLTVWCIIDFEILDFCHVDHI